jgi:hypothetical protein
MTDVWAFDAPLPRAAPGTYPVPQGRGRWRVTLHSRQWGLALWMDTLIAELIDARGRRLDQAWNESAQFTFTVNGESPEARLVLELATDVMAWRWDDQTGADVCMFRGVIGQAEDEITEQSATVTFTCHDYYAMLARRFLTSTLNFSAVSQDTLVNNVIALASHITSSSGQTFQPGAYLPLVTSYRNPDGSIRADSNIPRDRNYVGSTSLQEIIDDLAAVIDGFDFAVVPSGQFTSVGADQFQVFYPNQGVLRGDLVLNYGTTISSLTRSVNSTDYANYVRVLGNNGDSDPDTPQLYAEAWNTDSNNVSVNPVGLWMMADAASDVSVQSTLQDKANGDLALAGVLLPSYTLTMRPGAYSWGFPRMGDTVPLIINRGRLNVNTTIRVLGISYEIGDDGEEDVSLTVGRPATDFYDTASQAARDISALVRR